MNKTNIEASTSISISGKETKKHIATALKVVFPEIRFSLRSEYDQVNVYWIDGPLQDDVTKVLNRFESYTRVLSRTDYVKSTGYEWQGEIYVGARYLNAVRSISDERKGIMIDHLSSNGPSWADRRVHERYKLERELIEMGMLKGMKPVNCLDLMRDESPIIDERVQKKETL